MPDIWLNVDAALAEVPINKTQLIDDTDFKAREESVVYNQAGLDLVWNFVTTAGAFTQTAVTPTTGGDYDLTNQGNGIYTIEIPASGGASINNDTEGFGWFSGYATGILPWTGPVIGFRAAALNNALIDGGDNLDINVVQWNGAAVATPTTAGVPEVEVARISGQTVTASGAVTVHSAVGLSATAQGNLEDMYDGTGYEATTAPATQSQVGSLSTGSAAISTVAESYNLTTGTQSSGTVTDTETVNGTPHQHTDSAGVLELYYQFDVGGNGTASSVDMWGYLTSANDSVDVFAYNWGGASWDQIGTLTGGAATDTAHAYSLLTRHTGTGANLGKVRIRYYAASGLTSATLSVDQIYISYAVVSQSVGYAGGAVWLDTSLSNTNTESFVDGVADNPVSTIAAATTIASNVNLRTFKIESGSSVTLAQGYNAYNFEAHGATIALGSQALDNSHFYSASISGTCTSSSGDIDFHSCHIAAVTVPAAHFYHCGFSSTVTISGASDYVFSDCYSEVPGASSPTIDMGGAVGATNLSVRRWAGGITLNNLAAGDVVTLDGTFGTITLNGADAQVEIRGIAKEVVNNLTGSPTVNDDTVKADVLNSWRTG